MLDDNLAPVRQGAYPGGLGSDTLYSREWLLSRPPEELVEIIIRLKNAVERSTDHLVPRLANTAFNTQVEPQQYLRFPLIPKLKTANGADAIWRIVLYSSRPDHEPLGLELHDEVIVGRAEPTEPETMPDVDLTGYDARRLGVSRQHALLRPTGTDLLLVDLSSTNGTYCNAFKLAPGVMARLKDRDTLSLGGLHFMLRIDQCPEGG